MHIKDGLLLMFACSVLGALVYINKVEATSVGDNIAIDGNLAVSATSSLLGNVGIGTTATDQALRVGDFYYVESDGDFFGSEVTVSDVNTVTLSASELVTLTGGLDMEGFDVADENGNTNIAGALDVTGVVNLAVPGTLTDVRGELSVDEAAVFESALGVNGPTTLSGGLLMDGLSVADGSGDTVVTGGLEVRGVIDLASAGVQTKIKGSLIVDQVATHNGALNANSFFTVLGSSSLNGGLSVDTDRFVVADGTGDTSIAGTLDVSSVTNLANSGVMTTVRGPLTVSEASVLGGGLTIGDDKFVVDGDTGGTTIASTLNVMANTTLNGDLIVGDVSGFDRGTAARDAYVEGNLEVDGAVFFEDITTDDLIITGDYEVGQTVKIGVSSATEDAGDYLFIGPEGKISDNGGDVEINDGLLVEQDALLKGSLQVRNSTDTDNAFYVSNTTGNVDVLGLLDVRATNGGVSVIEGDLRVEGTLFSGPASIAMGPDNKINAFNVGSPATLGTIDFGDEAFSITSGDASVVVHPMVLRGSNFNVDEVGNLIASGTVSALGFSGDGSALTNLWRAPELMVTNSSHNGEFKDSESGYCVDGIENLNGYQCMNNWIQVQGCGGYHVCSADELIAISQNGVGVAYTDLWYNSGDNGDVDDCNSWKSDNGAVYANGWTVNSNDSYSEKMSCDVSRRVACCR